MEHEPSGLLRDAELPVQLHGRDTLEVRHEQIDSDRPQSIRNPRPLHDRSHLHCEHRLGFSRTAIPTAMRHRLVRDSGLHVERATLRAVRAMWPTAFGNPRIGLLLGAENPRDLREGQSLPVCLAWCLLRHRPPSLNVT